MASLAARSASELPIRGKRSTPRRAAHTSGRRTSRRPPTSSVSSSSRPGSASSSRDLQAPPVAAKVKLREIAGAFGHLQRAPTRGLPRLRRSGVSEPPPRRYRGPAFLLSTEELATLWHPPTAHRAGADDGHRREPGVRAAGALPPLGRHPDLAVLGATAFRAAPSASASCPTTAGGTWPILGKTGMGKSTLLHNLLALGHRRRPRRGPHRSARRPGRERSCPRSRGAARTTWCSSTPATSPTRSPSIRSRAPRRRPAAARRLRRRLGVQEALRRLVGAAAGAHPPKRPAGPAGSAGHVARVGAAAS